MKVLLSLVLVSTMAAAADSFRALDADGDLWLSPEEAARNPMIAANFDLFDRDRDRRLSPVEFNNIVLALTVEKSPLPIDARDRPVR